MRIHSTIQQWYWHWFLYSMFYTKCSRSSFQVRAINFWFMCGVSVDHTIYILKKLLKIAENISMCIWWRWADMIVAYLKQLLNEIHLSLFNAYYIVGWFVFCGEPYYLCNWARKIRMYSYFCQFQSGKFGAGWMNLNNGTKGTFFQFFEDTSKITNFMSHSKT